MTKNSGGIRSSRWKSVVGLAILSRIVVLAIAVRGKVEDYDQTGERVFPLFQSELVRILVGPFSKWDAVYFLKIAELGAYPHEQVHAFFPGLPLLMRLFGTNIDQLATAGWILSNAAFVIAAALLYKIYSRTDEFMAYKAAVIFSFSASAIFMSAIYTESLFACLSFACILFLENDTFSIATIMAVLAAGLRSNATFLIVYFAFIGLRRGRGYAALISSLLIIIAVQSYLHWSKNIYCGDNPAGLVGIRPSWCDTQGIYAHVQEKFWDVGLFKYWKIKNTGFFLLALPTILVAVRGVILDFVKPFLSKLKEKKNFNSILNQALNDKRSPYVAYLGACILVTLLIANVQIVTRLVSSSPAYFWAAANVFTNSNKLVDQVLLFTHLVYFFIGPLLFCNALPWT